MRVAERWFEHETVDDGVLRIRETHVDPFLQANLFLVRGRDRDVLVDTGLGIGSLRRELADLFERPVVAVATHRHFDHTGGLHEFDEVVVHRDDAPAVATADGFASLRIEDYPPEELSGYDPPASLLAALPHEGFELGAYAVAPVAPTRIVDEGDEIDLGDRTAHGPAPPRSHAGRDRPVGGGDADAVLRRLRLRERRPAGRAPRVEHPRLRPEHGAVARGPRSDRARRARRLVRPSATARADRRLRSGANVKPVFFATAQEFRAWLEEHHATATELWMGLYKKGSGRPSITWPEAVDEALCFGWVDSVRQRIDDERYMNRFTPRKPTSNWSAVNIRRVEELTKRRRMRAAGLKAFRERREGTAPYSYEQRHLAKLDPAQERRFRSKKQAWAWFQAQPKGYRTTAVYWVASAKKPETRERRLDTLIEDSAKGGVSHRCDRGPGGE